MARVASEGLRGVLGAILGRGAGERAYMAATLDPRGVGGWDGGASGLW